MTALIADDGRGNVEPWSARIIDLIPDPCPVAMEMIGPVCFGMREGQGQPKVAPRAKNA